jgi:hypothetical protein
MNVLKLDNVYSVICEWKNTKNGFKHEAHLLKNNYEIGKAKINYLNRTWEKFEYESVLKRIIDCYFEGKEHEKYMQVIKNIQFGF